MELFILTLSIMAGALHFVGYWLYRRYARMGMLQPERTTWTIFAFDVAVLFVLEMFIGASVAELLLPLVCTFGALWIAFTLYKDHKLGLPERISDRWVLAVAFTIAICYTSIILLENTGYLPGHWQKSATWWFLVLSNTNTLVGFAPLIRETYKNPRNEHSTPWFIWTVAYALLFFVTVLQQGEILHILYLYPASNLVLHALVGLLAIPKRTLRGLVASCNPFPRLL